ncbi:MAG: DUF6174 domain-containing protein [Gammaproteobacteria bacterium]|nr:DUF6174 domain-containing protein [Gammaproteobacteria bacterium]
MAGSLKAVPSPFWGVRLVCYAILLSTFLSFISACGLSQPALSENSDEPITTAELLTELTRMQENWAGSGIEEYEFSIHRQCDCPEQEDSTLHLTSRSNIERPSEILQGNYNVSSMDDYFTDLRQAVSQNRVKRVRYNPRYYYPETIEMQYDGRKSGVVVHTSDFRVLRLRDDGNNTLQFNGVLSQNAAFPGSGLWLVTDLARWYALNIPPGLQTEFSSIAIGTHIKIRGQLQRDPVLGQARIEVSEIDVEDESETTPVKPTNNLTNLNGILAYMVGDPLTPGGQASHVFSLVMGSQAITLKVQEALRHQAISLRTQQVSLLGYWETTGNNPAWFVVTKIQSGTANLEQFTGFLISGNSGSDIQKFHLVTESGQTIPLQLSTALTDLAMNFRLRGLRVKILGASVPQPFTGWAIKVVQIESIQNYLIEQTYTGTIEVVLPTSGVNSEDSYLMRIDSGELIRISIPSYVRDAGTPLQTGMAVFVAGQWINDENGQRALVLTRPPAFIKIPPTQQQVNVVGFISDIGQFASSVSCSDTQNRYTMFVPATASSVRLELDANTTIFGATAPNNNFSWDDNVRVTGYYIDQNRFKVESIAYQGSITVGLSGTVTAIGIEDTFSCTGGIFSVSLRRDDGTEFTLRGPAQNFLPMGIPQPGERVQANGRYTGPTYVMHVSSMSRATDTRLLGHVAAVDCQQTNANEYYFIDSNGPVSVRIDKQIFPDLLQPGVGAWEIWGNYQADTFVAVSIQSAPTIAMVPPPITGTIIGELTPLQLNCSVLRVFEFAAQTEGSTRLAIDEATLNTLPFVISDGMQLSVTHYVRNLANHMLHGIAFFDANNTSNETSFEGYVVTRLCDNGLTRTYLFVNSSGTEYTLSVDTALAFSSGLEFTAGPPLVVSGMLSGNTINVSHIEYSSNPAPMLYGPLLRARVLGTAQTRQLDCGVNLLGYHVMTDLGLKLVSISESTLALSGVTMTTGAEVELLLPMLQGAPNQLVLYPREIHAVSQQTPVYRGTIVRLIYSYYGGYNRDYYLFTTDQGINYELRVIQPGTLIDQGISLNDGARISVTGNMDSLLYVITAEKISAY